MKMEMFALPATFWASGMAGIRMVSVAFGKEAIGREVIDVKSVSEAQVAFAKFIDAMQARGAPFSARTRQLPGSRAVSGWGKVRLAHDWEPPEA